MDRTLPDTLVDQIAMLLSTDWFLPYWSSIGIGATDEKPRVQKGCREIVKHLMNGATSYYLIDFSEERLKQTRQSVLALARECELPEDAENSLRNLVDCQPEREQFLKGAWLFQQLTDRLLSDDELDSSIRSVLDRARTERQLTDDIDFAGICAESDSAWDNYIRGLTPELPTSLGDLLSVDLLAGRQLTCILAALTPSQTRKLLSRFQSVAKSVTGVDVDDNWSPL